MRTKEKGKDVGVTAFIPLEEDCYHCVKYFSFCLRGGLVHRRTGGKTEDNNWPRHSATCQYWSVSLQAV